MKTYKTIIEDIHKNSERINAINEEIKNTSKDDNKLLELCDELETFNIINAILKENYRHTLALAGKKALAEITAKYDGKALGEITDKTIRNDMRKRGFYVYFDRGYSWNNKRVMRISIEAVNGLCNAKTDIYSPCIEENGERRRVDFVNDDNKINHSAIVNADAGGNYCGTPAKKARDIKKRYKKYADAVKAASDAQKALNGILPPTMNNFNNVNEYLHGFRF